MSTATWMTGCSTRVTMQRAQHHFISCLCPLGSDGFASWF